MPATIAAEQYAKPIRPAAGQQSMFKEEDHPRDTGGKFSVKHGDVVDVPASFTAGAFKAQVSDLPSGLVGLRRVGGEPGLGSDVAMERDSVPRFLGDLGGRIQSEHRSNDADVNAVLDGKAKFLGRGQDGLAFDTGGGNVVKASSEVGFHWNNGLRSQTEGSNIIRRQVANNEKLRAAGVPGLLPQRLVDHDGRSYAVMPKVDTESPLTEDHLKQIAETVKAMHDKGYSIGDDIQPGIGADGRAYIYDTGAVRELNDAGQHRTWDIQDDESRLSRLWQKHGKDFFGLDPLQEYQDRHKHVSERLDSHIKRGKPVPIPQIALWTKLLEDRFAKLGDQQVWMEGEHPKIMERLKGIDPTTGVIRNAKPKPAAGHKSLFNEDDHPRGQPENAGEFAAKSGGSSSQASTGKPAAKSLFCDDDHAATVAAFEAAFAKPAQPAPLWQPKMFDAEPTGQKTMFDAGIEKGHGKPKPAAKSLFSGPSLVEQIESELSKMAKANKPLPQQKGMFSRRGSVDRYQQQWDESKHPRDEGGRFSEVAAQAHVASGKPFREWASSMVPHLEQRGYGNVEAQQIAFKAAQRVHRREKSEPVESAVKDAVGVLNHWADKKGPPQTQAAEPPNLPPDQAPQRTTEEPTAEPAIPAAPEWFSRLKEALEQRKSTAAANPDNPDNEPWQPVSASNGDDIHFKEWTPDDGAEAAPPPQPPKMPDAIEPLSPLKQLPNGSIVGATQMHVKDLKVDPKRFQYKFVGVGEDGVTKELKDTKTFNPMLGGQLLVWRDPGDGQTYVINGHHRFDLAKRSLAGGAGDSDSWNGNLSVYFIDADSPATARALGAVTNIAEGRGTAVDAAKFLRDTNSDIAELEKHGVSAKGAMARDAVPLSKLSPRIWQKVAQETVTPARGLAIAKHLGNDPEAQDQLFNIVEQREQKTGKDIPDSHVEEMAREMSMTPKHTEGGGGLFGDFFERSLLPERANLKSAVRRAIMGEKNAFAAVSSTRRAGTLQSEGKNTLDTEGNREKAQQSARQLEDFEQQSNWAGHPIAAAVNEAAQRLANEPRKAKSIEKQLIDHVRGILGGSAGGGDQLGADRQPVENADSTGSREGEPERHRRRRESHQTLVTMFDRALRKTSAV